MNEIDARPRVRVPATAPAGGVVELRTLLSHPMESGNRVGPDGARVPRQIVNRFVCAFDGDVVIDLEIGPSISANPYFEFEARVPRSGTFHFAWHDDNGAVYETTADIRVS